MITSIRPNTLSQGPQFAGKKSQLKKAGFIALMLGAAGGASALPNNGSGLALNTTRNNTLTNDIFNYTPLNRPMSKEKLKKMEALVSGSDERTLTESHQYSRKLLQGKATKGNNTINEEPELFGPDDAQDVEARKLLKKPPFAPTDINLLSNGTYPEASPMELAPVTEVNEADLKATLTQTLTKRFKGNVKKAEEAVKLFDDPVLKARVPDPVLRAAIVNLKGTAGESAIDVYKSDLFGAVTFKKLFPEDKGIAYSILPEGKDKREIWVNDRYQGEDFRLLTDTMAHEAFHQDGPGGPTEELVAGAANTLIYIKQIAENPSLARTGTELSRRNNIYALFRMNTRFPNGNLSLFTAQGDNVAPGGRPLANYAALEEIASPEEAESIPGNPFLRSVLKSITGKDVENPNFDGATLALLDKNQRYVKPSEIIAAAEAMGLDVGEVAPAPAPQQTIAPTQQPSFAPTESPTIAPEPANLPQPTEAVKPAPAPEPSDKPSSQTHAGEPSSQTSGATATSIPKRLLLALGFGAAALGLTDVV